MTLIRLAALLLAPLLSVLLPVSAADLPLAQIGLDPGKTLSASVTGDPIVIAVIDDGFRLGHKSLHGFLWSNPGEIANNNIDDDGNGYIDDVHGWDVSDADEELMPPEDRLKEYFHGTFSAGLITNILRAKLGIRDDYPIKIMLVKAVSDDAQALFVKEGYFGIEYALQHQPDVISNAWSGGIVDAQARQILNGARNSNSFIVHSTGNFYSPQPSVPGNHAAVFAVGAVDRNDILLEGTQYGTETDLVAVGDDVDSASVTDSTAIVSTSGTSVASPLVAATAAMMRLVNPAIKKADITACLKNTARPLESENAFIAGKIGAGMLQVDAAIECARHPEDSLLGRVTDIPEGEIGISAAGQKISEVWTLNPAGEYSGITFENVVSGDPGSVQLSVYDASKNSNNDQEQTVWSGFLGLLPPVIDFKLPRLRITLNGKSGNNFHFRSRYQVDPIDFEKRYCSGLSKIDSSVTVKDGSGTAPYAAKSDCKWLIAAKEGKSIHLDFKKLELELNDKIYLFKGEHPLQRDLLVTISGTELPPNMIIKNGAVLLWFLSDSETEHNGFEIDVSWIERRD